MGALANNGWIIFYMIRTLVLTVFKTPVSIEGDTDFRENILQTPWRKRWNFQ